MKGLTGLRRGAAIAFVCFAALFSAARAQTTTVSASYVGGAVSPVSSATIYFQPVNGCAYGASIGAARQGSNQGQIKGLPYTATVTGGVTSLSVPDSLLTNPNIAYAATAIDNTTGDIVFGLGLQADGRHVQPGGPYGCLQPTGSTWNFDTFIPGVTNTILPSSLFDPPTATSGSVPAVTVALQTTGQYHLAFTIPSGPAGIAGAPGPNCDVSSPAGDCDLSKINGVALRNIPLDLFADSIGVGWLAVPQTTYGYAYQVAAARGYTFPSTPGAAPGGNHSVAGDDLEDLAGHVEQWGYAEQVFLQQIGQNDGCGGGGRGFNYWQNMYEAVAAMQFTHSQQIAANAAGVTTTGTWSSPGAGYYAGAMQTSTAGATMIFSNVSGNVAYVFLESLYGSTSTVTVTSDDGATAQVSAVSLGQAWTSQKGLTHGPTVVRVPMRRNFAHTITITVATYDGSHPVIVDAVAGNQAAGTAPAPFGFFLYPTPTLGMGSTAGGGTAQTATTFSITSNVATIAVPGTYTVGQWVYLSGFANSYLNTSTQATGATQITAVGSGTISFALTHANVGSTADAGSVFPYAAYTEFYLPTCRESINKSIAALAADGFVAKVVDTDSACYNPSNGGPRKFPTDLLCIGGDYLAHPDIAGHALMATAVENRMANFAWQPDLGDANSGVRQRNTDGSVEITAGNYASTANATGAVRIYSKIANLGMHAQPDGNITIDQGLKTPQDILTGPNTGGFGQVGSGAVQRVAQRWSIAVGGGPTAQSATATFTFNAGDSFLPAFTCKLTLIETSPKRIEQEYLVVGSNGGTVISLGMVSSAYLAGTVSPLFLANPQAVGGGTPTAFTVDIANTDTSAGAFGQIVSECGNFNNVQIASVSIGSPFTTVATAPPVWPAGLAAIAQPANALYAGPASGAAALPTYRALVSADIPSVTLAPKQGSAAAITGTAADATVYTATIAAGAIPAGRCGRFEVWFGHTTGSAGVVFKWKLGAATVAYGSIANASSYGHSQLNVCNNAGVQNAQQLLADTLSLGTGIAVTAPTTATENLASSDTISFTFNAPVTDAVTPTLFAGYLLPAF